ncbi:MAG: hypothetical protein M0R80_16900 [Proteobacteria bacterium]|jgi:hypothetical protein|nr:hypothetical protein [Pseudomonadota bacterium]
MTTVRSLLPIWFSVASILVACEIDQGKIDLWKTTENGPKKLAGALIDPEQPLEVRVKAAIALVEIKNWELYRESFQKMEKGDAQKVIAGLAPELARISKSESPGQPERSLAKKQIDAKDGLYLLLDFAGPENRDAVEKPLIAWCVEGNYNIRAMAGYNIRTIVKKIGGPAAQALTELLDMDQIAIEPIAKLIRDVGDAPAPAMASEHVAAQLRGNVPEIKETHLIAAAVVGGEGVANALLDLATTKELDAELQRFALRAYSQSIESGYIKPDATQMGRLFAMAENEEYDKFQREETYLTLAQAGGKADVARVAKLLESDEFFWRLVGVRCILRMDGEGQLATVLRSKGLATDAEEVDEVIGWIAKFPKLTPAVRALLEGGDVFAKGVAVYVLGMKGDKAADVPALEKLAADKTKLPKGFDHATLGDAAKAALESLAKMKG